MRIEVSGAPLGSERFERPLIVRLMMSHDICIAIIGSDAEVHGIGRVPLIFYRLNEQHSVANPEFNRPLISLMTGIALHAKLHTAS
jgi:hypothetical protein